MFSSCSVLPALRAFVFTGVLGGLWVTSAMAQTQPCGWLSAQEVDRVLPLGAPWDVSSGGAVGMCQFMGQQGQAGVNMFSINQQFQKSAAQAKEFVRDLKKEVGKDYLVEPITELAGEGFFYGDKAQRSAMWNFVVHGDKVVLMGTIVGPSAQTLDRPQLMAMLKKVMQASPGLAKAAESCPYFEPNSLKKLVGGAGFKSQVFGQTSCMANNDAGKVLMISITESQNPEQMAESLKNDGCQHVPAPDLGPLAFASHGCKAGNPQARVTFFLGSSVLVLSLVPGAEPNSAQKADLMQMARFAANQAKNR